MSPDNQAFRTILIARHQNDSWDAVIRDLALEGYLVLTARNEAEAVKIAKTHSRPIHLVLVDKPSPALFAELQPYQPGILILIVTSPETALARVRELFGGPEYNAGGA